MQILWTEMGWEHYLGWQEQDKKTLRKINKLILSITRDGASAGEGKPELLKGNYAGLYSRRIDEKHRLIYKMHEEGASVVIVSCRNHYEDK